MHRVSETAQFISLLCKVCKIFNVGTPNKGIILNDEISMPLQNCDIRFQFLSKVVEWLDKWKYLPNMQGKLTAQTFTVCQILQSERLIKIIAILKLFSPNTLEGGSVSMKQFSHSFSSTEESKDEVQFDSDSYPYY